jgi:SpoVK/Ycf46/Vps4 family AAA+-type ATPase
MSRLLDIHWNDDAFQSLVMEENSKMMVYSLIKNHSSANDDYDDIISGKGKGLVGLFSGPPGSGKTLTAEAVAEITRRPLYTVSAGEIGIAPKEVDENLTTILELARKWNAVLLIDEADVFLQKRDGHDVKRNALVSIFLRQLEYFQGILILTTNRVTSCDSAFESRIHLTLQYPELNEDARKQIWKTFLSKAKGTNKSLEVDVSDEDIAELARRPINGRQVSMSVRYLDRSEIV